MSTGQHPPKQANHALGGDLSEDEEEEPPEEEPSWLREWWAKKTSDPDWEKRQKEKNSEWRNS